MKRRVVTFLCFLLVAAATGSVPSVQAQDGTFVVVDEFPHDEDAFTQGFDFVGAKLYEGTGLYGESDIRRVDLVSGRIIRKKEKSKKYFGEGVTVLNNRIYQITWKENIAFVYNAKTWRVVKRFGYEGEGWGLTHNGRQLVMSNGTSEIVFRDPSNFAIDRRITVTDGGQTVGGLNELEWVNGDILANVWPSDDVVRIDPSNGSVKARYDLSSLRMREEESRDVDVTNGIAYMPGPDRLFVTGKYWTHVYEIYLTP